MKGYDYFDLCIGQIWKVTEVQNFCDMLLEYHTTYSSTPILGEKFLICHPDTRDLISGWIVKGIDGTLYSLTEGWIRRNCQFTS